MVSVARKYNSEFKAEAVRLFQESDRSLKRMATELGVSAYALRQWVQAAKEAEESPEARAESEEIKRLQREIRVLREEREILRKAAAFFAKDDPRNL